ncbi:MAG TPA: T9SS type A sorting domain-containing protein, partial [Phaeodactylibacter sp.]|nr:T9SS type A sorting domain-containing protein [Phaeodactylibacter sp.]
CQVYASNGTYQVQVTAMSVACGNAVAVSDILIDQINAQQDIYILKNFSILPNPTTDFVFVKWETQVRELIDIELFDLNGKVILSKKYTTQEVNKVQLNVAKFPTGIYLGRLKSGDGVYSFKVVKR